MLSIWKAAVEQLSLGRDFALATIVSVTGSSPRHVGTRFLVRADGGIVGSIGGGLFEAQVVDFAVEAVEQRTSHRVMFGFRGQDSRSEEMICGGDVEVLVEVVRAGDTMQHAIFERLLEITTSRISGYFFTPVTIPSGGQSYKPPPHLLIDTTGRRLGGFEGEDHALKVLPEKRLLKPAQLIEAAGCPFPIFLEWIHPQGIVYIFGAGHVGECVAHLAAYVGFKVVVADDRADLANAMRIPDADEVLALDSFDGTLGGLELDEDSYVVIVTRGHAHDQAVLGQALRSDAGYIGMIGSRRKTAIIYQSLLLEGFTKKDLERVHAPIGIAIGGETPQEIAVSIVAELIDSRYKKTQLTTKGGCPA